MKILLLLLLILVSFQSWARSIESSFRDKDYRGVARSYLANKKYRYSEKEYIMISYALRKTGQFREDIFLNMRIIKSFYQSEHNKLLQEIRTGASTDPDEYSEKQKIYYWNIVNNYARFIQSVDKNSPQVEKDFKHFQYFVKMLEALEFREGKADKLISTVQSHLIYLTEKVYRFSSSIFFSYVSWQREVNLTGPESANLIVTNRGYCLGGDLGVENYRYHFYVDGCFLAGAGGINNKDSSPVYQQDNVPSYGFKAGPGASLIVSSSKSRIGFKLPIIYTIQKFGQPEPSGTDSYKVVQKNPLSIQASLYSRFNLDKWFIQTEFGQYLGNDEIFWGLGFGRQF